MNQIKFPLNFSSRIQISSYLYEIIIVKITFKVSLLTIPLQKSSYKHPRVNKFNLKTQNSSKTHYWLKSF